MKRAATFVKVAILLTVSAHVSQASVTGTDITQDQDNTQSVALGDVDGDGDLDLVAGNIDSPNRLYLNNGTTSPFSGVTGTDITTGKYVTTSIVLGDVDGDGDLDLITGALIRCTHPSPGHCPPESTGTRLYSNNGTGMPFADVIGIDISFGNHTSLALGDMDGDGDLDLVIARSGILEFSSGTWGVANPLLVPNNGTNDPFSGVFGTNISTDQDDSTSVALGDVDGDGDLDIVVGNITDDTYRVGVNKLYLNNGTTTPFSGVSGTSISMDQDNTRSVVLGDVDGDGDLDLVAGNSNSPNRLYLNNGTTSPFSGVTGTDITEDQDDTRSVALGDVDNDGDLDVIVGNDGAPNRLYLNNGTTEPFLGVAHMDISTDQAAATSVVLGDVDRDGDFDLVVGNARTRNRFYAELLPDTDGDGLVDLVDDDDDNDSLPDSFESENGLDPLDSTDALLDKDNDGLTNLQEFQFGTNLDNPDTDHDSVSDGDEVALNRNPLFNESAVIQIINSLLLSDE